MKTESAKARMDSLMRLTVSDWKDRKNEASETLFFLVQTILAMIKQNISPNLPEARRKNVDKISQIIQYIHQNIYATEKTQASHLATVFGLSKHYFGIFFKEQTGFTLGNYVARNKLHLIENRLRYSYFSIKEISNELGFTDLSHFNKFVKLHLGQTPSAFREQVSQLALPKNMQTE
ncbi:AraC family transcriptional regulator [Dyadobacter sp. CY326]|uniref:helix-turn-helix domain-containing protein n=1 Tax=Dyadobacter sp. CY326 TaxID=2907300 RepID=UPI001F4398FB|nr:AraC family transcriptional regulator [Dyadobacter sp. CY326]MCE7068173.1 AraC family transcriptional regulator [Dyadobacter sp. CY326]